MNRQQKGFTLIELVMVIVILGILSAIALPRFVNLQDDAMGAAKRGMSGAVKSAHAVAIAELRDFPTVLQLGGDGPGGSVEGYVQGENVVAVGTGVQVDINGSLFVVPTFTDTACSTATSAVGNTVRCVGSIPHP